MKKVIISWADDFRVGVQVFKDEKSPPDEFEQADILLKSFFHLIKFVKNKFPNIEIEVKERVK